MSCSGGEIESPVECNILFQLFLCHVTDGAVGRGDNGGQSPLCHVTDGAVGWGEAPNTLKCR